MSAADTIKWFEQALVVRTVGHAGDPPRTLFRCKVCAALVEGQWRAAHRYWHISMPRPAFDPEGRR